jgi:rSAM/selenodomain-associated transferase 2
VPEHTPSPPGPACVSVIVPVLNEAHTVAAALATARAPEVLEIIVVDGGSSDRTRRVAAPLADVVVRGPRGRAAQMNAGAARARGDVLLFLHADTLLPLGFAAHVLGACWQPGVVGGRFDVELQPTSPVLRLVAALMNLRSRLSRIATGDQAIFIRRDVFARLGGYAQLSLMEDIDLSRRMKRAGAVACLRARVVTSSRRWRRDGVWRTIVRMWMLRLLYFAGVRPETLARFYTDTR